MNSTLCPPPWADSTYVWVKTKVVKLAGQARCGTAMKQQHEI